MPTLRTITLGCKVNQYETEYVRQGFLRLGYRQATDDQPADLCIVNTCTVTAEGDLKSRKAIRRMAKKNPAAEIIVMGCYATRAESEVSRLPGVVEVITDKLRLPDLLARRGLIDIPRGISSFGRRHRAYVKVQDGCKMDCAYCIIPKVRPVLVSRSPQEVLDEIGRLVDHSHREIVLTGIHLGHYGIDLNSRLSLGESSGHSVPFAERKTTATDSSSAPIDLTGLVGQIVSMDGRFRLRLSSLEAVEVSTRLVELMGRRPKQICPHLHLSMQSGSDTVLKRMRRRWMSRQFIDKCLSIRAALDYPALTTDVIVGFPGETESDFEATCRAVETVGFSKVHVFRFSSRQGTAAADLPDDVPAAEKQCRATELIALGEQLRQQFFDGLIGREMEVLVESTADQRPGVLLGTSARYAPVEFPGTEDQIGRLVKVTAGKVVEGRIQADSPD